MSKILRRFTRILALPVLIVFLLIYLAAIIINAAKRRPFQPYNAHITVILVQAMRFTCKLYFALIGIFIVCYLATKAVT